VTSGNFSPVRGCGIALGFVDTAHDVGPGDRVELELRGRQLDATCVRLPFVAKQG
jgi:glycine cleavage system aminomethyltransferase T